MEDYPIHVKPEQVLSFDRMNMLWEKYPQFHEKKIFTTLEQLLLDHESYQKDFEEVKEEYIKKGYEKFLIQLSWNDLPYRYETMKLIQKAGPLQPNHYIDQFLTQFDHIDFDHKACFLFPESYCSQFFVIEEVCKYAKSFYPISNLFPDEKTVHYLAIFDKNDMDHVLLMYHLLYSNASEDLFGGYKLYDYPFTWYQSHLIEGNTVLRSPYLPDQLSKYQGSIHFHHNPSKTVYVRRNIEYLIEQNYFHSELEFFRYLTEVLMPYFEWWYKDLSLYEEKDGYKTNWRLERTKIRTRLTAEGIINPKWKHELSLFHTVRKIYPDTLYQYRPECLGRQSLDLYIPSLKIGIEYQGIQHYRSIDFFGGEEALLKRQELDEQKRNICKENNIILIEWDYSDDPTIKSVKEVINNHLLLNESND